MSAAPAKRGVGWPLCTLLLVLGLGALGWWSYAKWQEEKAVQQRSPQAARQGPQTVQPPAPAVRQGPPRSAAPVPSPGDAYRSLPAYLIAGFGAVMVLLLGAILYLWWSLKDLEGGKRVGEGPEGKG
ncbi:MAG: hypothetical protein HYT99_04400 [Candidatus Tectomicrobia bacterium]|nr:hypothetical protein [Candidatus Tectomicrobia bacterium]MBI3024544.1 hypothetical protein [Candidatus Tectomicrobia bacterium]